MADISIFRAKRDGRFTTCRASLTPDAPLAAKEDKSNLLFTESAMDADGADVFFSSGALQYVESPSLAAMLAKLSRKPRHLLLNKIPLHPTKAFVTLQNIGTAFCPYGVFCRHEFIAGLARLGYRLVDEWASTESCSIPFFPEHGVANYAGLYMTLESPAKGFPFETS